MQSICNLLIAMEATAVFSKIILLLNLHLPIGLWADIKLHELYVHRLKKQGNLGKTDTTKFHHAVTHL